MFTLSTIAGYRCFIPFIQCLHSPLLQDTGILFLSSALEEQASGLQLITVWSNQITANSMSALGRALVCHLSHAHWFDVYWRYLAWYMLVVIKGGVQPKFYVKLDFEIAVDQKGGTHDQTFEGVPNSQCRILCTGWPRPILAQKYQFRHTRSKPSKWVLYL